jgi:hypothetical protein
MCPFVRARRSLAGKASPVENRSESRRSVERGKLKLENDMMDKSAGHFDLLLDICCLNLKCRCHNQRARARADSFVLYLYAIWITL